MTSLEPAKNNDGAISICASRLLSWLVFTTNLLLCVAPQIWILNIQIIEFGRRKKKGEKENVASYDCIETYFQISDLIATILGTNNLFDVPVEIKLAVALHNRYIYID